MAKKTSKSAKNEAAKRSAAASKGWETRRAAKRSDAARKGWETRRAAAKKTAKPVTVKPKPVPLKPTRKPRPPEGGGGGGGGQRYVIPPERFREIEADWDDFDREDWDDDPEGKY